MRVALGADHRGIELKQAVADFLGERGIEAADLGAHEKSSVDYPSYAEQVALEVSRGDADQGILICGSGLGMSIAANKVPRIRAALCGTPELAKMARAHNNANVLVLAADFTTTEEARGVIDAWLSTSFEGAVRHKRRIRQIRMSESRLVEPVEMYERDAEVYAALAGEEERQRSNIILIASESIASRAVREAQASVLTNKYAEGYPGQRWYEGCKYADDVEDLAIERSKQVFGAEHANVQPHCGSSANMSVYFAVMNPGDTMLTMKLSDGGHLTHGHDINFSGRLFNVVSYGVSRQTEQVDYDEMAELAEKHRPKLIVVGYSSYSRIIDFKRVRKIADATGALVMADIAHIAGLVAGGCHPSPVPHCDFVTGTTHKTLCGPRGGFVLCRKRFAADIDRQIFPGIQGGPLMHVIAAKAVCFYEAVRPGFKKYMQQIVRNSQALANALAERGFRVVSGGTDNHLALIDLSDNGVAGRDAADALQKAGIILNKNSIPFDKRGPNDPSGIRVGTPTVTARGMAEAEMATIAGLIADVVGKPDSESVREQVSRRVKDLVEQFPVP